MTTTTQASAHADAYRTYRAAVRDAMEARDPDLTTEANTRRRGDAIRAARARLVAAIPPLPEVTTEAAREQIVSDRAPQTADQFAAFARQREKMRDLAQQGKSFADVVATADVTRLDAILDDLHRLPESERQDARDAIIDRLGELGVPEVVAVLNAEVELETAEAWHDALTSLAMNSEAEYPAMVQLSRVDPEGYAATFPVEHVIDWDAVSRIAPTEEPGA